MHTSRSSIWSRTEAWDWAAAPRAARSAASALCSASFFLVSACLCGSRSDHG